MNQFKVGDVKITRIVESEAPWNGTWILPDATREDVQKLVPHLAVIRWKSGERITRAGSAGASG